MKLAHYDAPVTLYRCELADKGKCYILTNSRAHPLPSDSRKVEASHGTGAGSELVNAESHALQHAQV